MMTVFRGAMHFHCTFAFCTFSFAIISAVTYRFLTNNHTDTSLILPGSGVGRADRCQFSVCSKLLLG